MPMSTDYQMQRGSDLLYTKVTISDFAAGGVYELCWKPKIIDAFDPYFVPMHHMTWTVVAMATVATTTPPSFDMSEWLYQFNF